LAIGGLASQLRYSGAVVAGDVVAGTVVAAPGRGLRLGRQRSTEWWSRAEPVLTASRARRGRGRRRGVGADRRRGRGCGHPGRHGRSLHGAELLLGVAAGSRGEGEGARRLGRGEVEGADASGLDVALGEAVDGEVLGVEALVG